VDEETFGRYRLISLIGQGGMGKVFRAFDPVLQREVAIKVLPTDRADEPNFRERFRREALTTAGLADPHVVPVFDSGERDGQLFLVMAVIDGVDLQTLLVRDGPMNPQRAVQVIEQVAAALDTAHAAGLVHRDVKPSNVLITRRDHVYLIDFGIARDAAATQITHTGGVLGTVAYMAPERFSAGKVDARGDVYSLACLLYECLTGQPPYPGDSLEQQITAHLTQPPPRPSVQSPSVTARFDDVVAHGMAKNPDHRYQNANELAAAARQALTEATAGVRTTLTAPTVPDGRTQLAPSPREPTTRAHEPMSGGPPADRPDLEPRRKRVPRSWVLAGVVTVVVAVVAASVVYFLQDRASTRGSAPSAAPQPAPSEVTTAPIGPPTIAATIQVGSGAFGVAVDPIAHAAYVTSSGADSVAVIDTTSRSVAATIAVGRRPVGVAVDPSTSIVYVTNYDDSSVSVINPTSRTVTATVRVGSHSGGVAVDSDARTAYVTNGDDGSVSVIDTTTNAVTATIPAGKGPSRLAIDPTAHRLYVTNGDATVSVIDTMNRTRVATVKVPGQPGGVAVDPAAHTAYVTNSDDASVLVIDTNSLSVIATVPVGRRPAAVATNPASHTAYVTNYNDASVSVIDTTSRAVIGILSAGNNPLGVAVDPTTVTAYVTSDLNHGSVSVIEH
jgi:serine/threonine protein kinase, bacterial